MKVLSGMLLAGLVALDQGTKFLVRERLSLNESIPVLPFFHLTHVTNTGAAFGILPSNNVFFIVTSLIIVTSLVLFRRHWVEKNNPWGQAGFLLIVAGAVGNLIDRLVFGAVTDFLDFRIWPVFNVADSCITVGVCLLFFSMKRSHAPHPA